MRAARIAGLTVVAHLLFGAPHVASATIDMTGRWVLGDGSVLDFTQVGTALTQTPPSAGEPGPRTGTIDPATGTFSVSDPLPCVPLISCTNPPQCANGQCGLSGTVAADGLTFTGTFACAAAGTLSCMVVSTVNVMGRRSPPTCGNGIIDPGEQCDDGTNHPGGCCDPGCRFVANGTPCGPFNFCLNQSCDGAGTCVTSNACKAPTVAGVARLTWKTKHPTLRWTWGKGQATTLADFGDPVHTDPYALCLYDESGASPVTLFFDTIPPGTSWRATGRNGFMYKNKLGVGDGVTRVILKAGADGKAKVVVNTLGNRGAPPPLPLPLTVQLRGHGQCWGAGYVQGGVKRNTASEFVAKSSPSGSFLDQSQ
jgi:cysteine-rich repeat protein